MALLDEKNLATEAAKRARFRINHVGTKLNQEEMHELRTLAAKRNKTPGGLIRDLILREIAQDKTDLQPSAEMVEITACRLLLVNLLGPLTPIWPRAAALPLSSLGKKPVKRRRVGFLRSLNRDLTHSKIPQLHLACTF